MEYVDRYRHVAVADERLVETVVYQSRLSYTSGGCQYHIFLIQQAFNQCGRLCPTVAKQLVGYGGTEHKGIDIHSFMMLQNY